MTVIEIDESVQEVEVNVTAAVQEVEVTVVEPMFGYSLWEADGATNIKPKYSKKVDMEYIVGVVNGGLFHP